MTMVAMIIISIGVLFNFFGCIGLIRLPDVYNRLQAATKCVTLGCCSILLGVFIHFGFTDAGIKGLIAIPLLFFSATVAAHALIRGTYHFGVKMSDKSVKDDYKSASK
ncbi:MAG TPA: monovalent cation/H(+) antiporter subunit G [Bacteroidales bacterium]|nr:monovalent cation/H(+) antiporter subunit G [Bacteroidales bacterium]HOK75268.1 monovalent cation/H(+) antiporter subunit G [Bacteroidales bacterium]HOM41293.1 monovalent cation/H(+) antiporter subunit G [Bacteroidales bacterium]HPP93157.1 monovalent cation/H(+) antiporter subunit G [Bacteroidales bacterium]HQG56804.1 monovalent cation/H(+) antiporter subunit G [Bacteroidales bacterium]